MDGQEALLNLRIGAWQDEHRNQVAREFLHESPPTPAPSRPSCIISGELILIGFWHGVGDWGKATIRVVWGPPG